ncbi:MAG: hypothetical protein QJR08_00340 [Bacillota bacterium]|nr:hypothetical protein [Bacillota bacterium]
MADPWRLDYSLLAAFGMMCDSALAALRDRDAGEALAAIRRARRFLPQVLDDYRRQGDFAAALREREERRLERAEGLALRGRFKAARGEVDVVSYRVAGWVLRRRPWRPTPDGGNTPDEAAACREIA